MLKTPEKQLAALVAEQVRKEDLATAALAIIDYYQLEGVDVDRRNPTTALPVVTHYLHNLLDTGCMAEAAAILWTPTQFNPAPECSRQVWELFDTSNFGLIMGAASMSKSFTMGVRLFLEWLRDPEFTAVRVLGPSEDHLEQNLFSHLVSLHQQAKLPMPGEAGELYIGLDRRNQLSAIRGVVVPVGKTKKSGRLQGTKRRPRPEPHPTYGPLSRLFIFLDEIENIPSGIWSDIDNVMSNLDEVGTQGLKIFGAYNPTNAGDEVYKRAEPVTGWDDFDTEKHFRWTSKRGWEVLRLDGERSENVRAGKVIYPGLQTRAGLDRIAKNAGGVNSPGYMSMGRGAYPLSGSEMVVVPPGIFGRIRGEFIWYDDPIPVGSCDLALEGGAAAVFSKGLWGLATGMRFPPSIDHPTGRVSMFKDRRGQVQARHALLMEQQWTLPKGDTVAMAEELIRICRKAGVKPDFFCCDRTGHGQGVADLMKHNWGSGLHAVNYSEGATDALAMAEDTKKCSEEYSRLSCELWFVMRKWAEFGYVLVHPQVDMGKLSQQIMQRRFRLQGGKSRVESKKDYMLRGFSSPDEADSFTLLIHAARLGSGIIPSMTGSEEFPGGDEGDDWNIGSYPGGVRIDVSNMGQTLNENDDAESDNARAAWDSMHQ